MHGLTGARLAVLTRLMTDGPLGLGELANTEGVAAATMSRMVDGLEEGKLVVRQRSPQDGRVVQVVATTLGRSLVAGSQRRRLQWLESRLSELDETDRVNLERAAAILYRLTEPGGPGGRT